MNALDLVHAQARDPGLWFAAQTAPEAYLQAELRRLHAAIEAETLAEPDPVPTGPLDAQIACVKREINMRQNVYPRWVANGRMTQAQADRELNTMRAVLATLERALKAERPGLFE